MRISYLCLQETKEGQASYSHVREIISGLEALGWDVTLFEPKYKSVNRSPLARMISFTFTQLRLIKYGLPDVLYVRSHFAALIATVWAKIFQIPIVCEINGKFVDAYIAWPKLTRFSNIIDYFWATQYKWSALLITVTPDLAKWVANIAPSASLVVVPNGANTSIFRSTRINNLFSEDDRYVVFFGALAKWQGVDTILEATLSHIWPENIKVIIAGDGEYRGQVELVANVSSRVDYIGVVDQQTLAHLISNSLASLSPQKNIHGRADTGLFPLKLFESLACGRPVIVTRHKGMADLVDQNECGIVIPENDPDSLAEAVNFLSKNIEEANLMGKRGQKIVVMEHSWMNRALDTHFAILKILSQKAD
ncbi:hypothetical protein GCM10022631_34040 [Deinococcus rubellus]|uniref:Glycosyltransferase family 4 protein n=1 Tax=Deinococcus rubellus TaxID=1889240 RepID=A0ABY5YG18_9DEIO|nr:glycosyltransferase family 4 protein [Deinococcus rubellus]UWX63111.1 glycosyltransferase family 4 protein [Deinococcus rubellus]